MNDIKDAIREDTILISVMHANNEIGTIQPIVEVGKIAKENDIVFHVDAVQSVGKIPVDVKEANIDLLSISSHKIYGPKGVGAIFIRKGVRLETLIHGGGQENGLRSSSALAQEAGTSILTKAVAPASIARWLQSTTSCPFLR